MDKCVRWINFIHLQVALTLIGTVSQGYTHLAGENNGLTYGERQRPPNKLH